MEITPIYQKPILYSNSPVTTISYWDEAVSAFDEKDFEASLTGTLNYINQDILNGRPITNQMEEIVYPHGSAEVRFSVRDGIFRIQSSFLRVPEQNKVPLLRKVAEINFAPLTLAQIVYSESEGGILYFFYEMPIELAQPNKVYDLIKEICIFADDFDDEFIKKYKASFYHSPMILPLSVEKREKVREQIQTYLQDASQYIQYYEAKRWDGYVLATIIQVLLSIVDNAYINGVLKTSIEEKIWMLKEDKNIDFSRKISIGKDFLAKLSKMPADEVKKDIFIAKKFISTKFRTTPKSAMEFLQTSTAGIEKDMEDNNFIGAFYQLKSAFLNLMYAYNLEPKIWNILTDSLFNASETSWDNGTQVLKETFDLIISGEVDNQIDASKNEFPKKKGFFAKLFS